jgi:hypothetical protein
MKKMAIMFFIILCSLFFASTPLTADSSGKYRPVQFDLSYAEGIVLTEDLHDLIKQKLQECMDDEVRWSFNPEKVNLSIKIIHLDVPSSAEIMSARLSSSSLPASKISGEVIVFSESKPVKKYNVNVSDKIYWPFSRYVNPQKNIAEKLANQIMNSLPGN